MKSQIELEKLYNDAVEPYAKELGLLLHAWNDLHITLSILFLIVCDSGPSEGDENRDIFLAIWNAVPNDRMQRHMLRQAAKAKYGRAGKTMDLMGIQIDLIRENENKELAEIVWALDSADVLGRKRDDSAHVPVSIFASDVITLMPDDSLEHPIAQQLTGKNLVDEFTLQRERMRTVSKHAQAIWMYLAGFEHQSWPQRPSWPQPPQSSERKA